MLSPALCGSSKAVVEMTDSPQPILKNASSVEVMPCKQCNCHNKKKKSSFQYTLQLLYTCILVYETLRSNTSNALFPSVLYYQP